MPDVVWPLVGTILRSHVYERAKAKGWKTITMQCGHDVMLICRGADEHTTGVAER